MKKLVLLFCMCMCIVSTSVNAENPGDCIEFMGVNGRIYCYSSGGVMPFRNAFSYCHSLGYHQATTNELCDISSEPSERLAKNNGSGPDGGCKNLVGVAIPDNLYWTAGLPDDTGNDSLVILMPTAYPTHSNPSYSGRHAICDTGKYSCPEGMYYDETEQRCRDLFCSYNYTAAETGNPESDCEYDYAIIDGVATLSSRGSKSECPANYFCALKWRDATCSSRMDSSSSIIYGVCSPKDELYVMCKQTRIPATVTVNEGKGCPDNQFCYLAWQNQTCGGIPSNFSGSMLYGVCVDKDTTTAPDCPLTP